MSKSFYTGAWASYYGSSTEENISLKDNGVLEFSTSMFHYIFARYSYYFFFKFEKKLAMVTRACSEVVLGRLREEYPKIKVSLSWTVSLRPN